MTSAPPGFSAAELVDPAARALAVEQLKAAFRAADAPPASAIEGAFAVLDLPETSPEHPVGAGAAALLLTRAASNRAVLDRLLDYFDEKPKARPWTHTHLVEHLAVMPELVVADIARVVAWFEKLPTAHATDYGVHHAMISLLRQHHAKIGPAQIDTWLGRAKGRAQIYTYQQVSWGQGAMKTLAMLSA